jgi:hypothetical protein
VHRPGGKHGALGESAEAADVDVARELLVTTTWMFASGMSKALPSPSNQNTAVELKMAAWEDCAGAYAAASARTARPANAETRTLLRMGTSVDCVVMPPTPRPAALRRAVPLLDMTARTASVTARPEVAAGRTGFRAAAP